MRQGVLTLLVVVVIACSTRPPAPTLAGAVDTPAQLAADSAKATEAVWQYLHWAKGSGVAFEDVNACPPDGDIEPLYFGAGYSVTGIHLEGDSAIVSVRAVLLARVEYSGRAHPEFRASERADTVQDNWSVIRGKDRKWRVCGIAASGRDFMGADTDSNTIWADPASSWIRIRAKADAINATTKFF